MRILRYAVYAVLGCIILLLGVVLFASFQGEKVEIVKREKASSAFLRTDENKYVAIGTGTMSLNYGRLSGHIPNLQHEVAILARNTRPDAAASEAVIVL